MSDSRVRRTAWHRTAAVRLVGSAVSWFVLGLSLALLFQAVMALLAIGGSCASGGPYEIRVECPGAVALFAPLGILGGFLAVGVSLGFARGFGMPLLWVAWPALFCGLGGLFLWAFSQSGDGTSLLVGALFVVMGAVPLVIALRVNPREIVLGTVSLEGRRFRTPESTPAWLSRGSGEDAVDPAPRDYLLSAGISLISASIGVLAGIALFRAAG